MKLQFNKTGLPSRDFTSKKSLIPSPLGVKTVGAMMLSVDACNNPVSLPTTCVVEKLQPNMAANMKIFTVLIFFNLNY